MFLFSVVNAQALSVWCTQDSQKFEHNQAQLRNMYNQFNKDTSQELKYL